jgi:phosphoserine phosphatase RsbU/P
MTPELRSRCLGATVAVVALAAIVTADLATRDQAFVLAPLFVLSPLAACALLSPRDTSAFAGAAVVLAIASEQWNHTAGTAQQAVRTVDVVLLSLAAVAIAAVRRSREQRFARLSVIAEVAQRAILPKLPTSVHQVAVATRYLSAAEDAMVGGDLYDCYYSDTRARFLIGDVRGKGIAAVEQAARVIRAFRQSAASQERLSDVAAGMHRYLVDFFEPEEFVTALLLETTPSGGLALISCGHPAPLLVGADGPGRFVELPASLPLGLAEDRYEARTLTWAAGDRLLLYTDGLSEARNRRGEFLSVLGLASTVANGSLDDGLDSLLREVRSHVPGGRLGDDLGVMLLEHQPPAQAAVPSGVGRAAARTLAGGALSAD